MPKTKVGDVTLNYEVHGEGEPLVLIGGLAGGNWQSWLGQIPRLAKRYRVLTFDNRGIGESDSPDYPYTTEMMATDTIGLMDALGIRSAHIFGKSLGGAVGQIIALQHPKRVRALVMTSSFAKLDPRGVRILENWRNGVRYYGWQQFCRELLAHFFTAEFFEQNPEGVARAEEALISTQRTVHGYMHTSHAVEVHDTWGQLDRLAIPCLLMCGAEDLVTPPRQSEAMAACIADSEVHIVPRSLHGFLGERPESLDVILSFLGRH